MKKFIILGLMVMGMQNLMASEDPKDPESKVSISLDNYTKALRALYQYRTTWLDDFTPDLDEEINKIKDLSENIKRTSFAIGNDRRVITRNQYNALYNYLHDYAATLITNGRNIMVTSSGFPAMIESGNQINELLGNIQSDVTAYVANVNKQCVQTT